MLRGIKAACCADSKNKVTELVIREALSSGCGTKHKLKRQFGKFLNSEDSLDVFWRPCLLFQDVTLQKFQNAFMTQWDQFPERISTQNCGFPWNTCQTFKDSVNTEFGVDHLSVYSGDVSSEYQNSHYSEKYRNRLLLIRFYTDIGDNWFTDLNVNFRSSIFLMFLFWFWFLLCRDSSL